MAKIFTPATGRPAIWGPKPALGGTSGNGWTRIGRHKRLEDKRLPGVEKAGETRVGVQYKRDVFSSFGILQPWKSIVKKLA